MKEEAWLDVLPSVILQPAGKLFRATQSLLARTYIARWHQCISPCRTVRHAGWLHAHGNSGQTTKPHCWASSVSCLGSVSAVLNRDCGDSAATFVQILASLKPKALECVFVDKIFRGHQHELELRFPYDESSIQGVYAGLLAQRYYITLYDPLN